MLTGVYSEETHLPQPLRISITVDMAPGDPFLPDTPLSASKSYLDLKHAATGALPQGVHFTLDLGLAGTVVAVFVVAVVDGIFLGMGIHGKLRNDRLGYDNRLCKLDCNG